MRFLIALTLLLVVPIASGLADEEDEYRHTYLTGQLVLGTSMAKPFADREPIIGFEFSLIPWDNIGFDISYYHISRRYYRFDHDNAIWLGPTVWDASFGGSQDSWPFYEDRHLITLGPRFRFEQGVFEFFIAPQIAFSTLTQPEISEYYPEFGEMLINSRVKTSGAGFALKVGAQTTFFLFGLGLEYQFDTTALYQPSFKNSEEFFRFWINSSNLLLTLGIKL